MLRFARRRSRPGLDLSRKSTHGREYWGGGEGGFACLPHGYEPACEIARTSKRRATWRISRVLLGVPCQISTRRAFERTRLSRASTAWRISRPCRRGRLRRLSEIMRPLCREGPRNSTGNTWSRRAGLSLELPELPSLNQSPCPVALRTSPRGVHRREAARTWSGSLRCHVRFLATVPAAVRWQPSRAAWPNPSPNPSPVPRRYGFPIRIET